MYPCSRTQHYMAIVVLIDAIKATDRHWKAVSLLSSYNWSAKQCSFHPTPRSVQTTLRTFVLATFTVLATIHYDRKKYTEPTAVHWGLQRLLADTVTNIQCWECRQGECLKRGLNKTSWQCETWHWSRSYTWNITPESWVELDIIYIYIYIIIMKQPFSSL